jgi:hypothetical protein
MYDVVMGMGSRRTDHHITARGRDGVEQRGWYTIMRLEVLDVRFVTDADSECDLTADAMKIVQRRQAASNRR